jgi:hypothetical protein
VPTTSSCGQKEGGGAPFCTSRRRGPARSFVPYGTVPLGTLHHYCCAPSFLILLVTSKVSKSELLSLAQTACSLPDGTRAYVQFPPPVGAVKIITIRWVLGTFFLLVH